MLAVDVVEVGAAGDDAGAADCATADVAVTAVVV